MTRILSLDDDLVMAEMFRSILAGAEYEAVATSNVHEALLILRTQPVDLITQDLQRPVMVGEELLRLLKDDEDLGEIPVLLITGYTREACAQFLREFDLDIDRDVAGYLQKGNGIGPKELLDAVATALEKCGKPLPPKAQRLRTGQES